MYTEVKGMKKTESITYRTDKKIKEILMDIAKEKKWTISQLSEEIVREWLAQNYPDQITDE